MKKIILALMFLSVADMLSSQSLLWRVSGKGIKSPSYIYGTIHIQDKKVFGFDNTVLDALASCDAFAMEILMDNIDPKELKEAMLMKDNSLDKLLTKEQYATIDSIMKVKTGQGVFLFNKMKPFFLSSQLMQMDMQHDMETALDLYLLDKARKADKACFGVEKLGDQISAVDAISLEEQAKMLYESVTDTSGNDDATQLAKLLQAYLDFDLPTLLTMSADTTLPPQFNKVFLIDRNVGMAKNFKKIAKKQSLFCAVGAAHLPGDDGVIALLRKKGLTVEPVKFEWKQEN